MVRIRNKIIAYILTICMLLNVVLPNLYVTAWAVDSIESAPDVQIENFNEILELDNVPVGESVDESTTSQETQDTISSEASDDLLTTSDVNSYDTDSQVDLSSYIKNITTVSGTKDLVKYSHQFDINDGEFSEGKFYNPIYVDPTTNIEYIVITNKAQLRAIGTDAPVIGSWATLEFKKTYTALLHPVWEYKGITNSSLGDMFAQVDIDKSAPSLGESGGIISDTLTVTVGIGDTGKKYSKDANYLIVNDIDLGITDSDGNITKGDWTPWDYTGTSIKGEVRTIGSTDTRNPVISNINVVETAETKKGVGFFGAVYSPSSGDDVEPVEDERPWWDIIGNLLGALQGLVTGLLKTLGGLATDIIGSIAGWEDITSLTSKSVSISGLTLENVTVNTDGLYQTIDKNDGIQNNPMPVGGFAGQISGNVTVSNCKVENLNFVSTNDNGTYANKYIGGFVGKTVGATDYLLHGTTSGLSNTLEGLGGVLDSTLNFLLPTDDLVSGLVSKLGISNLVPTKYIPVKIQDCMVSQIDSINASEDHAGGFAGKLEGTQVSNCTVSGISSVCAKSSVGGFAGKISNTVIVGLLQGLGVNLVNFPVGSEVTNCKVEGNNLVVTSTLTDTSSGKENALAYAGGFAGAIMASDVIYDGSQNNITGVTGLSQVVATGSYVGGFAGYAGVGDLAEALNLLANLLDIELNTKNNEDGKVEVPLGDGVDTLLETVLGVNLNAGILSLIGLKASQIVGCTVQGSDYSVISSAGSRTGGFIGYLYGGKILEQPIEDTYSRVQATDKDGNLLYVSYESVTTETDGSHIVSGAVYSRLDDSGNIIYEDVHGDKIENISTVTVNNNTTIYNVYDTVFINLNNDNKPTLMSSFKNADWESVVDTNGDVITDASKLSGYPNIAFPVYQQTTTADGYVKFIYNYAQYDSEQKEDVAKQEILYRKDGKYYTLNSDGTYTEYTNVNTEGLTVDALQVAVDDSIEQTGTGSVVTTYIKGLGSVSAQNYVGGVVGQAKLCSGVDLLSNLTVAQYERFEINNVKLADSNYTVKAKNENSTAGGAIGYAMGGDIVNVNVSGLNSVEATSYAGGFAGQIIPGTVAGENNQGLELLGLINVSNLLTVIDAVHTFANNCSVSGIETGFTVNSSNKNKNSASAGFVAWSINSKYNSCAVSNLASVEGDGYAGGFCAVADSGSIAGVMDKTFNGINLSNILGLSKILSVINAIPNEFFDCTVNINSLAYTVRASAHSEQNEISKRVNAQNRSGEIDGSNGSAGGFIGYGAAVQIENCSNENLKSVEATSYAGGFGGFIEIGSVAQIGNAGVLGQIASLTGIATLLDCAASTIKTSHCQGTSGGYDITAFDRVQTDVTNNTFNPNKDWNDYGIAGGFVGNFEGSHIEGSYANHINKIQGEQYAGGFVGRMVAGDIAKAADNTSLIADLIKIDGGLLGALQIMVPSIKNSYAKCVPCGGTVLSYGTNNNQTTLTKIGIAGGYVGLNAGGQIWGNYDKSLTVYELIDGNWQQVTKHTAIVENRAEKTADYSGNSTGYEKVVYGTGQTCDILQLLKVDATCYAGGYSGYTKAADLASLGNINLLGGLADLSGLLSVGQVVVPTQRNTGITGPLRNVTSNQMAYFNDKNALSTEKADFSKYYGYTVGSEVTTASGGYNGVMTTGVIENSIAYDLISVTAIEQAGGFAGAILTGGVANADLENSLLGGLLSGVKNVTSELLGVVNAIIPVIKTSGVYGYYSGSKITASNGCSGGFIGTAKGGQIWGETGQRSPSPVWQGKSTYTTVLQTPENALIKTYEQIDNLCFTRNLRSVTAKGLTSDAGGFIGYMGAVSIASLGGLGLLGDLVALPNDIVTLLSATVPTVYYADVSAVDDWGFYVLGDGARSAGGFAGFLQGAQVGIKDEPVAKPDIDNIKSNSNITVSGLRSVTASDYAGGFFGYANAADTLNVSGQDETGSSEQFTLLQLVTIGQISAIELAKSYIYNGSVNGIADGYRVESLNAYAWKTAEWNEDENKAACAGGFGGLLQAGIVRYCKANDLSLVSGKNYAGGFVARMGKSSILKANDVATTDKLGILGDLLGLGLGVGDIFGSHIQDSILNGKSTGYSVLSQNGYHNIAGGFVGYADVCRIKNCQSNNLKLVMSDEIAGGFIGAMSDAMLLSLDLGLLQKLLEGVTVGLDLIKANRSKIENVTLKGVDNWDGYDVYGGGSSETKQANTEMGYAGAFIGLNFGSTITTGDVIYADTIKGAVNCINPYFGTGENTALLTNLELDVLLKLIDFKGDLSKSEIIKSYFETRTGSTTAPSDVTPETHSGTELLSSLTTPYYAHTNEADLMVENVTHTLTIKKELKYEEGTIANINDFNYEFEIQIWQNDVLIDTVSLSAGDSYIINNPSGTYTIKELPQSVLQDMVLAQDQTVTITNGESKQVIMLDTITSPPQDDNQTTTDDIQYSSTSGKFIINRIPTGDVPPEGIENPCEILNEITDEQPMFTAVMLTKEGDENDKTEQTKEDVVFDYNHIIPAYTYLQQHILLLFGQR